MQRINKEQPGIPFFTKHDSIVTTTENLAVVEKIMKEEIKRIVGDEPQLKPEYFSVTEDKSE